MNTLVNLVGTNFLNDSIQNSLDKALLNVQDWLERLAENQDILRTVEIPFGEDYNQDAFTTLVEQWQAGNFQALPAIEIRSAAELQEARGAYAAANNTIYLSQEYISQNADDSHAIADVLLEEIGHFVDTQVNETDAPGDEGAIFVWMVFLFLPERPNQMKIKMV